MSLTQQPDEAAPLRPVINHVRQIPVVHIDVTEPDAEGTRVLTIDTPMPDSFVLVLPDEVCDYLKGKLNGGVILARPGDVPTPPPEKS